MAKQRWEQLKPLNLSKLIAENIIHLDENKNILEMNDLDVGSTSANGKYHYSG